MKKISPLLQTIVVLCFCVVLIYKIQDVSLEGSQQNIPISNEISAFEDDEKMSFSNKKDDYKYLESNPPRQYHKIWVTMAVCWSANTNFHGKDKYPYKEAVHLSTQLWLKQTEANVIVQVVYSEKEVSKELKKYKNDLESYGVLVKLVPSQQMDCVLKSQIVRMLVFNLPEVSKDDIVVTADVDAFIMTPDIMKPLLTKDVKIWIYRYLFSLNTGATFMMPFIGAISHVWKDILFGKEYKEKEYYTPENFVELHRPILNFSKDYTWDIDQRVSTHAILKSRLCSLPQNHSLWETVHVEPKEFDDSKTCWHGSGIYEDCNNKLWLRNTMLRYHGGNCKWWHFYPDERIEQMKAKFKEIMLGEHTMNIFNNMVGSAKSFQKNMFGTSIF